MFNLNNTSTKGKKTSTNETMSLLGRKLMRVSNVDDDVEN